MLPKRGCRPDTKRVTPDKLSPQEKKLFKKLRQHRWVTPSMMNPGYRFSGYVFTMKAKGYRFKTKDVRVKGKLVARAFRLVGWPKE